MRAFWLFAVFSLCGFLIALLSHSPGWMGLGLALGFVFALVAVIALAGSRIGDSSRQEMLSDAELEHLRASIRAERGPGAGSPRP
ncbi:MAG TPA: hypothetical protein VFN09_14835 [Rhodanobacteraceae bacterium]|nr:hypothetical protein [Rhodanobacteraceae bacterium]